MTLPKKGSRKITVQDTAYLWKANNNGEVVNLTIAPSKGGKKIRACFNFNTEHKESNTFNNPFVITPYVTKEVILFAIQNGYCEEDNSTEMNLGNLNPILKLDLSGVRKTKKLIQSIEKRIHADSLQQQKAIKHILKITNELIQHGEWFIGFEILLENLNEIDFNIKPNEVVLMKEIFLKAKVDWRKDWKWIEY